MYCEVDRLPRMQLGCIHVVGSKPRDSLNETRILLFHMLEYLVQYATISQNSLYVMNTLDEPSGLLVPIHDLLMDTSNRPLKLAAANPPNGLKHSPCLNAFHS